LAIDPRTRIKQNTNIPARNVSEVGRQRKVKKEDMTLVSEQVTTDISHFTSKAKILPHSTTPCDVVKQGKTTPSSAYLFRAQSNHTRLPTFLPHIVMLSSRAKLCCYILNPIKIKTNK
jgi:hypothetical protein